MTTLYIVGYILIALLVFFGFAKYYGRLPLKTVDEYDIVMSLAASLLWPVTATIYILFVIIKLIGIAFCFISGKKIECERTEYPGCT